MNLSNIKLNPSALEDLISLLEINHTLIMIDVSDNEGLNYKRVRYLQSLLKRNQDLFEKEKHSEWQERKDLK